MESLKQTTGVREMAKIETKRVNKGEQKVSTLGFGYFDKKGRELGAQLVTSECEYVPVEVANGMSYIMVEPEFVGITVYCGWFRKTKNGEPFGAGNAVMQKFKTRAERDSWAAQEWLERLKRAEKDSGK